MPPKPEELIAAAPHMDAERRRRAACCELVLDVARSSGEVRLRVTGASMLPALWPGDLVTVQRRVPSELAVGQVVVYRRDEKLIVHRITRTSGDHLITQGDSRPFDDLPVQASEIVGQVAGILRNGRCVHPEQSVWQRAVASILRRSDLCTRIALGLNRRLRRSADSQTGWASALPLSAGD